MSLTAHAHSTPSMFRSLSLLAFVLLTAQAQAQSNSADLRQQPAAIGVSPSTAADANERAAPRADTGTVVRTGPSAGERVDNVTNSAADTARNGMRNAAGATRDAMSSTPDANRDLSKKSSGTDDSRNTRRPRSDRG